MAKHDGKAASKRKGIEKDLAAADKEKWDASDRAQCKRLIKILEEMIEELKAEPEQVPEQVDKPKASARRKRTARKEPAAA